MTIAERIAALPVATNIVGSVSGKLTQLKPGEARPAQSSSQQLSTDILDTTKFYTSLYAVDNSEYSKESAVNKQWRKMGSFNLVDVLDGTADISNLTLSAKELEARLQQGGLLDEVSDTDFRMLEFEFSGVAFKSDAADLLAVSEHFHRNVDYLASRYAAMEDRIKNSDTGTQQKEQLNRLEAIYQHSLERTANEYAGLVGGILEQYGVSGEKEKIYQSFKTGVDERAAAYRDFLSKNPDFTHLEGTEDEWLLKDDEYMAQQLRNRDIAPASTGSTKTAGNVKAGNYTLHDLEILGQYACSLSTMESKSNAYEMNEERIGLELAMVAMKTDALVQNHRTGTVLRSTLQAALRGFTNAFLEQLDRKLSEGRTQPLATWDVQGNAALDRKSVWNVYNKTMENYRISGDAMQALIKGAEYGKAQYSQKMGMGSTRNIYRYQNGSAYWNHFFGNSANMKTSGYDIGGNTYDRYMMGWLDFKNSLQDGHGVRMNLSLHPQGSYAMNHTGNWLSANA